MASASVIVSAYNNLTLFRKALRGYLRQSCLDFNLIIADDGSKPDLEEWLQQFTSESKTVGFETKHVRHEDLSCPPGAMREDHLSANSSFRFIRTHFKHFSILASKHIGAPKIFQKYMSPREFENLDMLGICKM